MLLLPLTTITINANWLLLLFTIAVIVTTCCAVANAASTAVPTSQLILVWMFVHVYCCLFGVDTACLCCAATESPFADCVQWQALPQLLLSLLADCCFLTFFFLSPTACSCLLCCTAIALQGCHPCSVVSFPSPVHCYAAQSPQLNIAHSCLICSCGNWTVSCYQCWCFSSLLPSLPIAYCIFFRFCLFVAVLVTALLLTLLLLHHTAVAATFSVSCHDAIVITQPCCVRCCAVAAAIG